MKRWHDPLSHESSYVPSIKDDPDRYANVRDPVEAFTLIDWDHESGRLRENATGLVLGPTDSRLPKLGIFPSKLRGEHFHREQCVSGDFRPGKRVELSPEPDNPWDSNAIAVYDETRTYLAAYINKQRARQVSKLIREGDALDAFSIRGTGSGREVTKIGIIIAHPDIVSRILRNRETAA